MAPTLNNTAVNWADRCSNVNKTSQTTTQEKLRSKIPSNFHTFWYYYFRFLALKSNRIYTTIRVWAMHLLKMYKLLQ